MPLSFLFFFLVFSFRPSPAPLVLFSPFFLAVSLCRSIVIALTVCLYLSATLSLRLSLPRSLPLFVSGTNSLVPVPFRDSPLFVLSAHTRAILYHWHILVGQSVLLEHIASPYC